MLTPGQQGRAREAIAPLLFCSIQCYTYAGKVQDCGYFVEDGGVRSDAYDSPTSLTRSDSLGGDPLNSYSSFRAAADYIGAGRLANVGRSLSPASVTSNPPLLGAKTGSANPLDYSMFTSFRSVTDFMGTTASPTSAESEVDPLEDQEYPETLREWLESFGQGSLTTLFVSHSVEFLHIILGGLSGSELIGMGLSDSSVRSEVIRHIHLLRQSYSYRTKHDVFHSEPLQQDECFADLADPFE